MARIRNTPSVITMRRFNGFKPVMPNIACGNSVLDEIGMITTSSITPTRKSRRQSKQAMNETHRSVAPTAESATAAPHRTPNAMSATATAAWRAGGDAHRRSPPSRRRERKSGRPAAIADMMISAAARADEAHGVALRHLREDRREERLLRGERLVRIRRQARNPHQHAVGNAAREAGGDLHAQALRSAEHDPIAHGEPVGHGLDTVAPHRDHARDGNRALRDGERAMLEVAD